MSLVRNLDNDNMQLNDTQRSRLAKELKGLKVEITHCQVKKKASPTENIQLNDYNEQRSLKTKDHMDSS